MNILGKIKAYIEITRPINIMLTIAVVIGAAIISDTGEFDWEDVFYASLAAAFAVAAGNIINDLFDIGIDIINCPSRPLPSKRIKPIEAKIFYLILLVIIMEFLSTGLITKILIFTSFHQKDLILIVHLVFPLLFILKK